MFLFGSYDETNIFALFGKLDMIIDEKATFSTKNCCLFAKSRSECYTNNTPKRVRCVGDVSG